MQLYFGKVDLEEFKDIDPNEVFSNNGNYYWYKAVIDEEQVCFFDTCGRHFPIALEHCGQTDTVMFAANKLFEGQEYVKKNRNEVIQLLKYWENNE